MFDEYLIHHCAPTLYSVKSANLFSIRYSEENLFEGQIIFWNRELSVKGVSIRIMKKKPGWALLYVYRKAKIEKRLQNAEVAEFLGEYGYEDLDAETAIERLKARLNEGDEFPHEIGIFLDYPLGDVKGFIKNAGCNYKCSGCWKVYSDECEAMKLFRKYDRCRQIFRRLWNEGKSIQSLTVAA